MKHKNKFKLVLFCMAVLALAACKGNQKYANSVPPSPSPSPSPEKAGILGLWSTACEEGTGVRGEPSGYHYTKKYYFINDHKVEVVYRFYRDDPKPANTCSDSENALLVNSIANYTLGNVIDKGSIDEHTNINITNKNVIFLPKKLYIAKIFNDGGDIGEIYSGYGLNWRKDFGSSILGQPNANKIFSIGAMAPDILQVSNLKVNGQTIKVLKTGDKQGNLDADGRPLALNKIYAKFQHLPWNPKPAH